MAAGSRSKSGTAHPRRRRIIAAVAGVVGVATLVGLAAVAQGYDERELPRVETSVWVSRDSGRYARVNTTLGEIDTIRSVQDPSTIVQAGADGVVFGQGFGSLWAINSADPTDLVAADSDDDDDAGAPTCVARARWYSPGIACWSPPMSAKCTSGRLRPRRTAMRASCR